MPIHCKDGWYQCRQGIKKSSTRSGKPFYITIQWSLINRQPTNVRGLKRVTSKERDLELFLLSKTIDGLRVEGLFDSEKEALTYYDKALIKRGKQPKFIFKKK